MMLSAFLLDIKQRYVFAGSAAGGVLPLIFYNFDVSRGFSEGFVQWALSSPSQMTLAVMPVWAGLVGLQLGRSRAMRREIEISKRVEAKKLRHAATHDVLTGLRNRTALEEDARVAVEAGQSPALLLLDLDRFKLVNDTMGHDAGDELLIRLSERFRALQVNGTRVYRLGGDEFVFLVPGKPEKASIDTLCADIANVFYKPVELAAGQIHSGVSIGISTAQHGRRLSTMLKNADLALYKAKDMGACAHVFYEPAMAEEAKARARLERDLLQAVERNEIFLEFQPILSVETRAVRAFEALVRWQHPHDGCLMPMDFIPLAERTGLILPLGRRVLELACREAVKWPSPMGVSVNVSGMQFKSADFPMQVRECLKESGLAPGRLTLEIAENVFALELSEILQCLEELRKIGVRIVLDDFGAGFASVSNMQKFRLDQLKLDRSFAAAMLKDKGSSGLMDVMMRFGASLKVSTAIEGIEDETQMDFVRERGASEVQGFLFSKPVPANEVEAYIRGAKKADDAAA